MRLLTHVAVGILAVSAGLVAQQPNAVLSTIPIFGNSLHLGDLGDQLDPAAFDLSAESALWSLTFIDSASGVATVVGADDPGLTFAVVAESGSLSVAPYEKFVFWLGGQHPASGSAFSVIARIAGRPGANVFDFDIYVDNQTVTHTLHEVEYPRVQVRSPRIAAGNPSSAGEVMAVPIYQGVVIDDPVENLFLSSHASAASPGGYSMQWLCYYDGTASTNPVFFFGTRDPRGMHKEMSVSNRYSGGQATASEYIRFSVATTPEGNTIPGNDYLSLTTFPAVVGVVRGDWVDAAGEYRRWLMDATAVGAPTAGKPVWMTHDDAQRSRLEPLSTRPAATVQDRPIPLSVQNLEFFLTMVGVNPGDFDNGRWQVDQDSQRSFFQVTNTITTVYGWHAFAFGGSSLPAIGDWFPVQPGFALSPRPSGVWAPYVNVELIDDRSATWSNPSTWLRNPATGQSMAAGFNGLASQWMYRDPGQNLISAYAPTSFRPCPAASNAAGVRFMEAVALFLADQNRQDGARGIYFDESSALGSDPCYDSTPHGHAPGGGSYQTVARRDMMRNVASQMGASVPGGDFHTQSEAPGEVYSDLIHIAHEHAAADFTGNIVPFPGFAWGKYSAPLYAAVYHDYQHTARILFKSNNWRNGSSGSGLASYGPFIRRALAFQTWFGDVPSGGSDLGASLQPDILVNRATPGFPEFVAYTDFLKRLLAVVNHPLARSTYHVGRRLRDPASNVGTVSSVGEAVYVPWFNGAPDFPKCYLSAWRDEPSEDFGICVANWTAATDAFGAPSQSINVSIDADRLGVTRRNYNVVLVTSTGTTPLGTFDLSVLPVPFTIPVQVGQLDAVYIAFEAI